MKQNLLMEIKPCPFCNKPMQNNNFFSIDSYPEACGCWEKTQTAQEAVDVWNTRPIEDALQNRIAELEDENAQSHDIVNDISELNSENVKIIAQYIKHIAELKDNLNALQTKYEDLADDYIDLKESK